MREQAGKNIKDIALTFSNLSRHNAQKDVPVNSVEQNPNETETPAATGIRLCGAKIDEETTYHDAMAGSHVSTILYVSIILLM